MTKLLIVDDNLTALNSLHSLLVDDGFEVETAVNGEDALNKAQNAPPDVIISDILMPVMDGYSLIRQWVQNTTLKHIPFIFYTATYTDERDLKMALELGAACFIKKPAHPPALLDEIRHIAQRTQPLLTETNVEEEPVFLKKYNELLINKLEEKLLALNQANQRLNILYQASIQFNTIQPIHDLISFALHAYTEALGYTYATYFAYDNSTQLLHLMETVGFLEDQLPKLHKEMVFKLGNPLGLVGLVAQTKQALIIPDTSADPRWMPVNPSLRSALFVPLTQNEELLGIISFQSEQVGAFNEEDSFNAMTLANNLALVIRNAQLFESQRSQMDQLEEKVVERTAELKIALEKAEAATWVKSQFISDMNHELRTPLSNIKLYLQLLDHGKEENKSRYMETLNRETARLQQLIDELLDLSRIESEKTAVNLIPTDINQLVGNLIMARLELAHEKGISLDFHPGTEDAIALVDPQLFFQVLANLWANAVNYTPAGGSIWLQTETAVEDQQQWITVSIIDNGPGISNEDLPHIFERFYRGQIGRESGVSGTGLGLALCYEIMERHEGRITAESIPGMGSKFTAWIKQL
ncbi:MAG: response regulator [Anaerolineales bacterium]|nr:response regulator [Anaerolineales bacterium]MCB8937294.1 response regulator [Ardenticatenaceae bacterium]